MPCDRSPSAGFSLLFALASSLATTWLVLISHARSDTARLAPTRAEKYQVEIVKNGGLPALLRLLRSSFLPLVLSAAACVRNVSIHPANESPIIESGFLAPLIDLLAYDENEEVQVRARRLSSDANLA